MRIRARNPGASPQATMRLACGQPPGAIGIHQGQSSSAVGTVACSSLPGDCHGGNPSMSRHRSEYRCDGSANVVWDLGQIHSRLPAPGAAARPAFAGSVTMLAAGQVYRSLGHRPRTVIVATPPVLAVGQIQPARRPDPTSAFRNHAWPVVRGRHVRGELGLRPRWKFRLEILGRCPRLRRRWPSANGRRC